MHKISRHTNRNLSPGLYKLNDEKMGKEPYSYTNWNRPLFVLDRNVGRTAWKSMHDSVAETIFNNTISILSRRISFRMDKGLLH